MLLYINLSHAQNKRIFVYSTFFDKVIDTISVDTYSGEVAKVYSNYQSFIPSNQENYLQNIASGMSATDTSFKNKIALHPENVTTTYPLRALVKIDVVDDQLSASHRSYQGALIGNGFVISNLGSVLNSINGRFADEINIAVGYANDQSFNNRLATASLIYFTEDQLGGSAQNPFVLIQLSDAVGYRSGFLGIKTDEVEALKKDTLFCFSHRKNYNQYHPNDSLYMQIGLLSFSWLNRKYLATNSKYCTESMLGAPLINSKNQLIGLYSYLGNFRVLHPEIIESYFYAINNSKYTNNSFKLELYPTVTRGTINLEGSALNYPLQLQIADSHGKIIYINDNHASSSIDLSQQQPGIYYFNFLLPEKSRWRFKVVKTN